MAMGRAPLAWGSHVIEDKVSLYIAVNCSRQSNQYGNVSIASLFLH